MRPIDYIFIFIISALLILGCEKEPAYPNWTTYNTSNSGIPDDNVWDIEVDGNDNVWMLTSKLTNLTRFNGEDWRNMEIPGAVDPPAQFWATALAIDHENNVWFNLKSDVSLKYTTDSIWVTFNSNDIGLYFNAVQDIAFDKIGNVYFGSSSGLIKYDGVNWSIFGLASGITAVEVLAMAVDIDNSVWLSAMADPMAGGYTGVSHFDGVTWTTFNTGNSGLRSNGIRSIAIEQSGTKWFEDAGGVTRFDGNNWLNYDESSLDILPYVHKIHIDNQNNKWFCTLNRGLIKYDGVKWTVYDTSNSGIPYDKVNDVAVDAKGSVWVATNKGLARFKP